MDRAGNASGVVLQKPVHAEAVHRLLGGPPWPRWQGGGRLLLDRGDLRQRQPAHQRAAVVPRRHARPRPRSGAGCHTAYYGSLAKLGAVVHGHLALRIIAGVLLLPLVAIALLWHVADPARSACCSSGSAGSYGDEPDSGRSAGALLSRRSRSAPRAAAALALALLASHPAQAQTPYWENQSTTDETSTAVADQPARVSWHAGVRLGPYIPGIDKQLGLTPGPYKAMFGTSSNPNAYAVLPMLDVDRVLWRGFGQLGVGVSGGYMSKSAHTFLEGCRSERSESPESTARQEHVPPRAALAPTSSIDSRISMTQYGIPLVPYVRGGLSYYIWWVSTTNGDLSSVCADGTVKDMCPARQATKEPARAWVSKGRSGLRFAPSGSMRRRLNRCATAASSTRASMRSITCPRSTASDRRRSSRSATTRGSPASTSSSDAAISHHARSALPATVTCGSCHGPDPMISRSS